MEKVNIGTKEERIKMKSPCINCLIASACTLICDEEQEFFDRLVHNLDMFNKYVYSKNGRRRKHLPNNKRKHWNHLCSIHNNHIQYREKRFDRLFPDMFIR